MGESKVLKDIKARKTAENEAKAAKNQYYADTYGLDILDDGDILFWEKQFSTGEKVYQYTAMRGGGFWYLTNREGKLSWFELLEEIERDNVLPIAIYSVTEMELFITEEDSDDD